MRERHESMLGKGNNQAIREVNRSIILDLVRRAGRVFAHGTGTALETHQAHGLDHHR